MCARLQAKPRGNKEEGKQNYRGETFGHYEPYLEGTHILVFKKKKLTITCYK